jgi:hypothetical protein
MIWKARRVEDRWGKRGSKRGKKGVKARSGCEGDL